MKSYGEKFASPSGLKSLIARSNFKGGNCGLAYFGDGNANVEGRKTRK